MPFDIGIVPGLSLNGRYKGHKVRNTFGVSFGWSRAARVDGMALALGAVIVDEHMQGVAASIGANITRGTHRGVQFATGYNYAADLRGLQHGGLNRADRVQGLQVGLINVGGHVRGAQFGLVNWAKSADASFALLPITKEGGVRFEASTSDTAMFNVGLRLPARYTYTFFGAGLHPFGTRHGHVGTNLERGKAWEFGGGFGGHIPVKDGIFIDIDLSAWGVTSGLRQGAALGSAREGCASCSAGKRAEHLAIFGGPTLNVLVDDLRRPVDRPGYGWVAYSTAAPQPVLEDAHVPRPHLGSTRVRVWPGFVVGLRF